jgi:arginine exporter protein ArgO
MVQKCNFSPVCLILLTIGTVANSFEDMRNQLISGGKSAASRIWFALKIIHHQLLDRAFFAKVYHLVADLNSIGVDP